MQKYRSQGRLAKIAVSGVVISLFSIAVFTLVVNSPITGVVGQNINYFAANTHNVQAVFNVGVECIYPAEPVSGNIVKPPSSSKEVIPLFYTSSIFSTDSLYPGKYIYFSDKIPHKSFRQVCLVFDIPPPIL